MSRGLVLGAAALAIAIVAISLPGSDPPGVNPTEVFEAGRDVGGEKDPFAWDARRRVEFEARGAAGLSHPLYEHSPGGVIATAQRTERWRDEVEAAAAESGADADLLEAMVFLESAGRPDVIAGADPEAAAGLVQIVASTGIALLDMEIDLERSRLLTERMAQAAQAGEVDDYRRLRRARAAVDQRFRPEEALAAAGRYLAIARGQYGREDLAIESYHMGMGNLTDVIRAYTEELGVPVRELVEAEDLSWAQLYFDTSPLRNAAAHELIAGLADESGEYLWKVLAAREIIRLYREDRDELVRLAELHAANTTQEDVFHPPEETERFEGPEDIVGARLAGELESLPSDPSLGFIVDRRLGGLAARLGEERELYLALRPEALVTLVYMASQVKAISGERRPLVVTGLDNTGWSFDIRRDYASDKQARAFQFVLDRLRALAVIDYAYEPRAIRVTVSHAVAPLLAE